MKYSVPSLKQGCWAITNVLIPRIDAKQGQSPYEHATVVVRDGWISTIAFGIRQSCPEAVGDPEFIDGTDKLLLPGFMNGHTHSSEMWVRGQIGSYPLELWLACLRDFSPGDCESVYLSALHTAYKTLMSGGTALMDHLSPVPDKVVESGSGFLFLLLLFDSHLIHYYSKSWSDCLYSSWHTSLGGSSNRRFGF